MGSTGALFTSILLCSVLGAFLSEEVKLCRKINAGFERVAIARNETAACRCYFTIPVGDGKTLPPESDPDDVWIGCHGTSSMTAVFDALNTLNETIVSKLWVWDAGMSILPADIFAKIRVKALTLERSYVAMIRDGAFSHFGRLLKHVDFRNNIMREIKPKMFHDLSGVKTFDISGNKITEIKVDDFMGFTELEQFNFKDNQLAKIADSAFHDMGNLKVLNLAGNKITRITKDTFRGLHNLEFLDLEGNAISDVDWRAFDGLKNLKFLNLGINALTSIDLKGLDQLQRLLLNNNSIQSLKNVSLKDLTRLQVLSFDSNLLKRIDNDDLSSLSQSPRLLTLSLSRNKLAFIGDKAFEVLHQLTVLNLDQNELPALNAKVDDGLVPYLRPLKKLTYLDITMNNIEQVTNEDLEGLSNLKDLIAVEAGIKEIGSQTFKDMRLQRLYLNGNQINILPEGLFSSLPEDFDAVDISDNPYHCFCGYDDDPDPTDWVKKWISAAGPNHIKSGSLGCLKLKCPKLKKPARPHPWWVMALAALFCLLSAVIAVVIVVLAVCDPKTRLMLQKYRPGRKLASDMESLISTRKPSPGPVKLRRPPEFEPSKSLLQRPLSAKDESPPLLKGTSKKSVRFQDKY
ncbi:hypothetical protein QR680_013137 [Steinernema hermaphroditum]|uniref:LRRCT domain-containing protein n=1 Tax=Steinernema hermaphroditum TaxID=289476 RepID=A0AA39I4H7_9BILA|nr:hypothetical protein QR680_013137 [Steinernema hermaphroditum]